LAKCQRLRRAVLFDYPFDGDARIDDECIHRSSRPLPKEKLRWRLFPASRQLPQVGDQFFKGRFNFVDKGLAEDLTMLGFGRAAVPCRATLQTSDQVVVQIESKRRQVCQPAAPPILASLQDGERTSSIN
jgi:hypothetical protein